MKIDKQSLLLRNKVKILLLAVLILAAVLRLWKITEYPAGFNADEAAIGYNTYSLLQTGNDEHGNSWPIHFISFGDYKPGGYFYLVLPFVKFLGLNELAVRLPSALLGILTVLLIYLLVKELFASESFAILSALFLATSPWHLHFSRGGWETNTATTFIVLGTWLFLKGLKNPKFYIFSSLAYVFSMYTYHSTRVVVPFLVLGLIVLYRRQSKWLVVSGLASFILLLPLIFSFFSPAGMARFSGVGFLSETGPFWRVNELRGEHQNWNSSVARLLHNKVVGYSLSFAENYLDHFQGEFLFLSGDVIERNRVPETGQMYLFNIPFVLLGFYLFLKNRPHGWQVIFLWLVVAPLGAALTFQTPHALRALNMVIPLVVISTYGVYQSILWFKDKMNFKLAYCLLLIASLSWSLARYVHQYYVHYPKTYPVAWEYGFKNLVDFIKPLEKDYDKILVTDKYDQPYILFLFYLKYPPEKFQKEVVLTPRDKYGFSTVRDFGKYHFESIDWSTLKDEHNTLVVGTEEEIPVGANVIKTINFPNGRPAFRVAKI